MRSEGRPEGNSVLLYGESGTGKTYSIATLIEAGLELFVIGTEPRFLDSLEQAIIDKGLDRNRLHTQHVYPSTNSWDAMLRDFTVVSELNYEGLTNLKPAGAKKAYGEPFLNVIRAMANFTDDRTGEQFGPVDKFGPDRAVVVDSTTGLAYMSMALIVGSKPVPARGEWGAAMDSMEKLNLKFTSDIKCFFVMTGHVDRDPDPTTSMPMNFISTLGQKLSPKWGRFYSEVVLSYRDKDKFWWSTITPQYSLKRRHLPFSDQIQPTFVPIVQAWKKRKELMK